MISSLLEFVICAQPQISHHYHPFHWPTDVTLEASSHWIKSRTGAGNTATLRPIAL